MSFNPITIGHPEAHEKLTARVLWSTDDHGYHDAGNVLSYRDASTRSLLQSARASDDARHVNREETDLSTEAYEFTLDEHDLASQQLVRQVRAATAADPLTATQSAQTAGTVTINYARLGLTYPLGVYNVMDVHVSGSVHGAMEDGVDYTVDKPNGTLTMLVDPGTGDLGETLTVTYDCPRITYQRTESQETARVLADVIVMLHNQFSPHWLYRAAFSAYLNITAFPDQSGPFATFTLRVMPDGPVTWDKRPEAETLPEVENEVFSSSSSGGSHSSSSEIQTGESSASSASSQSSSSSSPSSASSASSASSLSSSSSSSPSSASSQSSSSSGDEPVTGMAMWLDANQIVGSDLDVLATWSDVSGNARHGTQATAGLRPIYRTNRVNGKPAVLFGRLVDDTASPTQAWLTLGDLSAFTEGEIFAVIQCRHDPGVEEQAAGIFSFGTPVATYQRYRERSDQHIYSNFGSTAMKDCGVTTVALNNFHLLNIVSKSGEFTIRIDGTTVYTTATNSVAFHTACYLGQSEKTGSAFNFFYGFIAEVLLYNSVLTAPQRAHNVTYLNTKYALPVSQSSSFPTVSTGTLIAGYLAGELVLSNGDPVTTWSDHAATSGNVVQATGSLQPIYTTNVFGTYPAVVFDGVDDFLQGTLPASLSDDAFTLFFVGEIYGAGVGFGGPFSYSSGALDGIEYNNEDGSASVSRPHLTVVRAGAEVRNDRVANEGINLSNRSRGKCCDIWGGDTDGATLSGFVKNGQTKSVEVGSGGYSRGFFIGKAYAVSKVKVAVVLLYRGSLNPTDLNTVQTYMRTIAPFNFNPLL